MSLDEEDFIREARFRGRLDSGVRGAFVGNSRGASDLFSSVEYISEKGQEQRASWEQEDDQGARVAVLHQEPHQILDGEDLGKNELLVLSN